MQYNFHSLEYVKARIALASSILYITHRSDRKGLEQLHFHPSFRLDVIQKDNGERDIDEIMSNN